MSVDLHVHTTASDGSESPRDVVYKAKNLGLEAIAITDHDTFRGIDEALNAAKDIGLEVISGIELSTEFESKEVHVLGYLMDTEDQSLSSHLDFFKRSRVERVIKIVAKLQELGISVSMEEVLAQGGNGTIGRPHVARVLVEKGVVNSVGEAFDEYIGQGGIAFVPRTKYSPVKAVKLIRQAGGIPVLAHPGLANLDDCIPVLVREGLQGIEVYHPQHNQANIKHYLRVASRWDLLVTGGSDYHGPDARGYEALGTATVSYEVVKKLHYLAGK